MDHSINAIVSRLEETNDRQKAYFSYGVDDNGEEGVIRANAEGLRLYAAELLKKSLQMEQHPGPLPCKTLCFGQLEWVVSPAGYDLITGVQPLFQTRQQILSEELAEQRAPAGDLLYEDTSPRKSGCLASALLITAGFISLAVALHWFS